MTLEEKIQNFYDISMETASNMSVRELANYKEALDQIFEEHQETARRQNDLMFRTEEEECKRLSNMEISHEQLELRREYSRKEEELTEMLFAEAGELLTAYKATPDYVEWMRDNVRHAANFARGAEVDIYIDPSDEELLAQLRELAVEENATVQVAQEEAFGGGTRAIIRSRNILIDNSFARRISEVRENYQLREEIQRIG